MPGTPSSWNGQQSTPVMLQCSCNHDDMSVFWHSAILQGVSDGDR